ncbi:MAG TPA: hypothetical protein VMI74_02980 [Burkholderiales bacterium]|nr:hypothetical protein [Burkholderiales bacterium]
MLTLEQLKQAVHKKKISKTDAALLCVAAAGAKAAPTLTVRQLALESGVKGAKTINFHAHLDSAEDKVFKAPNGWELTDAGRKYVAKLAAEEIAVSPAAAEAQTLRALLPKLKNEDARAFVTEAIVCAEQSLFRASVVLSWVGAIALLHDRVVAKHLAAFNVEATKRIPAWKPAKNADDLGNMREATFLEIGPVIGLFGKNVKQELEACLKTRNSCGHPTSLKIGSNKVAAHLEILALNVYAVFGK